jgi:hypothetical protein
MVPDSEQYDGVDVKNDLLISVSHFIHLTPLHTWRAVAQLVLRHKPVRFPMVSLEFFLFNPSGTVALGSTQPLTKVSGLYLGR